ncbi:helix-turn-helix transcriptional regulator [Domibacillus sp. DTU_2020_1001157_1_SI_ALB_TIR_016]|uniref:helix-turn-helix domain-containing protein n=1 Tax=Domibacillus sp. DTU_2020_1001157_1_SI_ALB_TIR_016 TaxID=3077789 RepID=UPI0028E86413|nr:helix-turn-helix transcriptional regulator [Domibacillus sp. DTU_2020_1001157_1_SI_ALB_TIR_016]WNS78228.1 helix-turn-helix transcriptional regulator [Domibacillus sp. DTU_2020_1001157_1_SI_ALB_TIR_016]
MPGERLRSLREKARLTQKELASRLNVPNQNISNYERIFRQPDYETLQKLADYYDVSTDYLLGRTDTSKKENNDEKEMMNSSVIQHSICFL